MKKLILLLLLTGCATVPLEAIYTFKGGYTFYQDAQEKIQEFCQNAGLKKNGKIYGCYVPSIKWIAFEKGNWCIATHETLHALIGEWHKGKNVSCIGE